ncbi:hypothetical protein GCM10007387_41750 [Pseudoduganella albidiflava]|uniref:VanZ-like domain-containing protein n=2 Tax=Pseudoduganella albidiflava TaxID=321983 RepID=A0AA87XV22_9BURK|nr:hypothetical protein GCM10007387_41750 [Pseudoduganella albidiflava]
MRWELVLFLLGMIAIPLGCLLPFAWLRALPNDKLLHFTAFGSMALLGGRLVSTPLHIILVLLAVLAASWVIEVLQNLVPGRRFCWRDMAANLGGVLCAGACLALLPHG